MMTLCKTRNIGILFVFLLFLNLNIQIAMGFEEGYFIPPLFDPNPYTVYSPESTITVRMNYTISYRSLLADPTSFRLWMPYLSNISTGVDDQLKPSQTARVLNVTFPLNVSNSSYDPTDVNGNAYDYFEKTMQGSDQSFYLQYQYEIVLNGEIWQIPDSLALTDYDNSTPFYQFYTAGNPYSEVDDPLIKSTVTSILQGETKIAAITHKIYEYTYNILSYEIQNDALSAKTALQEGKGDCSEYSSLMVTLLRAAGIPARKVLGVVFADGNISALSPKYDLEINDTWSYSTNDSTGFLGHAWVQYYVPTLGWISADPTWGEDLASHYYNQMDYIRLATSVGDWYVDGIDPALFLPPGFDTGIPEFPFIYPVGNSSDYEFSAQMDFLVINATIGAISTGLNIEFLLILLGNGSVLILIMVFVISRIKKRQRRY